VRLLHDIPDEQLSPTFNRLAKKFIPSAQVPFPLPAHFLDLIDQAKEIQLTEEADQAWQALLTSIHKHYHPDIGWRGPKLTEHVFRSAASAGGVHNISQMTGDQLVWAKKRFIEAYLRDIELTETHPILGVPAEIKVLVESTAEKKALPQPESQKLEANLKSFRNVHAFSEEPYVPPTDEELARRQTEQKKQLHEYLSRRNDAPASM